MSRIILFLCLVLAGAAIGAAPLEGCPPEWAAHIKQQAAEKNVPLKLVAAILSLENPSYDPLAAVPNYVVSTGEYHSCDLGLWQINSLYLQEFVCRFWGGERFYWDDPYDNSTLAIAIIASYYRRLGGSYYWTAVAYNGGLSAALNRRALRGTAEYANMVLVAARG